MPSDRPISSTDALSEALRVSESRYRRLFESAQDGILLINADTAQIEDVNPYLIDLLGYSHGEFLGKKLWEVGPFADIAESKEMFAKLKTTGYVRYEDLPLKTKPGARIEVECVSNTYDCEGIKLIQCSIRNITTRKAAEAKIQRYTQLYAALSQCNKAIVHCSSEEELFLQICRAAVQFGGMKMAWVGIVDTETRRVIPAASFGDYTVYLKDIVISVDADSPFGRGPTGTAIRENRLYWCQDFLDDPATAPWRERATHAGFAAAASLPLHRKGIVIGAFTLYSGEVNAFDESVRDLLVEMATDIGFALDNFAGESQRERVEEEIIFKNTILQTQQETSLDAILVVDQNGQIISYNRQFIDLWRLSPQLVDAGLDEPVLQSVVDQVENSETFVARIKYLYEHRDEKSREEIPLKDGRIIDRYSAPVTGADGRHYGRVWYFRDITERKRAAEALRASRDLLGSIIENVPIRVFWKDAELRYLGCNSLFARDAGMSRPEELVGKDDFQMGWREQAELYRADDRRVIETNAPKLNFEEPQSTPDGHTIWLRTSKVPMHDADGKLIGLLGIYDDVTERIRAQQALRESYSLLEATERLAGIGGFRWEREGDAMFWSKENFRIFGRDPKDGTPNRAEFIALAHPDDQQRLRDAVDASIGSGKPYNIEFRIIRPDGSVRYIHAQDDMKFDKDGKVVSGAGMHQDITERKLVEAKIVYLNRVYAVLSSINTLIVRVHDRDELFREACRVAVDAGRFRMALIAIVDRNAMNIVPVASAGKDEELMAAIQGLLSSSEDAPKTMVALAIRDKKAVVSNDALSDPRVLLGRKYAESGVRSLAIFPLIVADEAVGAIALYATEIEFFHEEELNLLAELADDIAFAIDHIEKQERIDYLAYYDMLTGLPNRALFSDRVKYALSIAERNHVQLAILFLDLDRLKNINDSIGHNIGDKLLIEVAKRLKLALRNEDTVSRQGGDEFVMVLPTTTADGAAHVASKLLTTVALAYRIEQYELSVTSSIGIAIYPSNGESYESLYKCADIAMYRAKHDGGNNYKFFTAEMQTHSARTLQLENALRHALEHDQFRLHYQPQMSLQDGRVIGAEALLRWQHPELVNVSPAEFIPIAENSGQILQIGEWVLGTAVRQMKSWMDCGIAPMIIAVNLSAVQFRHPNLPDLVTQILNSVKLPTQYLELELTEGVAMHDPLGAISMMDSLHERGVRMSIDDFGTGYSSLSYLKRFQVYKLKIDQSFVRDISDDPNDKAIVSAIINLASSLGLKTIAEGVETEGQLAFLREQGCDEVQGYYFSKPLPAEQFEAFVRGKGKV